MGASTASHDIPGLGPWENIFGHTRKIHLYIKSLQWIHMPLEKYKMLWSSHCSRRLDREWVNLPVLERARSALGAGDQASPQLLQEEACKPGRKRLMVSFLSEPHVELWTYNPLLPRTGKEVMQGLLEGTSLPCEWRK